MAQRGSVSRHASSFSMNPLSEADGRPASSPNAAQPHVILLRTISGPGRRENALPLRATRFGGVRSVRQRAERLQRVELARARIDVVLPGDCSGSGLSPDHATVTE